MESYAGEIPQAATKAKNDKRFEGRIAVGIWRFTLETHQIGFIEKLRTRVGHTGGGQVQHMLWRTAKFVL